MWWCAGSCSRSWMVWVMNWKAVMYTDWARPGTRCLPISRNKLSTRDVLSPVHTHSVVLLVR